MSRVGFSCAIVLIAAIAASGAAYAQTPAPAPKSTAVPADLDAKIKRSVKERAEKRKQVAAKRAECNKQAKAQKLGVLKRRTFVRKCMAG